MNTTKLLHNPQLEADRIRNNLCPVCGQDTKDKGSYIRCTTCGWSLSNGEWLDEGYIIDRENHAIYGLLPSGTTVYWDNEDCDPNEIP